MFQCLPASAYGVMHKEDPLQCGGGLHRAQVSVFTELTEFARAHFFILMGRP